MDRLTELLEKAAEEIENCYGRETKLSEEIRNAIVLAEQGRLVKQLEGRKAYTDIHAAEHDEAGNIKEMELWDARSSEVVNCIRIVRKGGVE